jgi:uncharacterized delta-60 repeat protein
MSAPRLVRSGAALVVVMAVVVVLSAGAQAVPGDLDVTFSGDGKQTTDFGFGVSGSSAAATVRQPDGKIVAVGIAHALGGGTADFALARYNPNGSLDPSFSGGGRKTTDFGADDGAAGVALQGDGKIVAVGESDGDFALARYNPDGSLDTSFSGDGKQTTDFGGDDGATGVALQSDGKIVVGGRALGGGDFALARYNTDGSPDVSFSGNGTQTTDFGFSEFANAVALQGDGKIVAVGFTGAGSGGDFALARYDSNGSLDPSFSGDGRQTTDFTERDEAKGVALQGDGKILAVGGSGGIFGDFALARYNPNGSLDPGFSGDGKQTTNFGDRDEANGVALQANGKIVTVGIGSPTGGDFALARYNPDGSLDPSFSGDGKQDETDFGGDSDEANGVALQGAKIIAVGFGGDGGNDGDFALARYNSDGSLDTNFSRDGKQTTNFGGDDGATGVALQGDGKIVAVGATGGGGGGDFALARYNPNGTLDTSFSGDGKQTTDFGDLDGATGVALQGNGKIVVVGVTGQEDPGGSNSGDFALARYNPNGSVDTSFSGDGKQTTDFGGTNGDKALALTLQNDGKIIAVGRDGLGSESSWALARYNPNGSLDPSFSGDGKQTTLLGQSGRANAVALQADGKIVAVGAGGSDWIIARYNPNGSLDPSFSGDGVQTTPFGARNIANGVAIQGDGKIVAVGEESVNIDFALARYNSNGSPDTSFSGDGRQTTNFGAGGDDAKAVALQGNKIVAVGKAGPDLALARYNPNGSLDTSFSGDGKQTTDFGGFDEANGLALQGDGKIVAAGVGLGIDGTSDFALARYLGG